MHRAYCQLEKRKGRPIFGLFDFCSRRFFSFVFVLKKNKSLFSAFVLRFSLVYLFFMFFFLFSTFVASCCGVIVCLFSMYIFHMLDLCL